VTTGHPVAAPAARAKGPRVWRDLDQAELDAAYDQAAWAPNREQLLRRHASQSDAVRARLGAPLRYAYGPTPVEGLDVFITPIVGAPINVLIHGGAWRAGLARNYAYVAELFVRAGAHLVAGRPGGRAASATCCRCSSRSRSCRRCCWERSTRGRPAPIARGAAWSC
jgi:acetyl esterase/lipase